MSQNELLGRVIVRPDVFGGKPIIRDLRISVELILSLLAQGESSGAILDDYLVHHCENPDTDQPIKPRAAYRYRASETAWPVYH
ncbi:DUF433 domain-containing protein [Lamprobacter sp.]|uniref:DUF433 domain-containing protein n=1 Tax=Lamprobacter sp. TaxID=3100796 RepID=UPI003A4D33F8